jgi:hypothetical protein
MGKVVKIILALSLIMFMGFAMATKKKYSPEEDKIMSESVHEIIGKFCNDMYDSYGLMCSATGGSMPYDVEAIIVYLDLINRQVSLEEARELEVKAIERLTELVNAHEAIRPYLREYPWNTGRSKVLLAFYQKDGKDYSEGIRLVLQAHNKLVYFGPQKSLQDIDPLKREPFEEAKKIVDTSPSCLSSFKPKPKKKKFFGLF